MYVIRVYACVVVMMLCMSCGTPEADRESALEDILTRCLMQKLQGAESMRKKRKTGSAGCVCNVPERMTSNCVLT